MNHASLAIDLAMTHVFLTGRPEVRAFGRGVT